MPWESRGDGPARFYTRSFRDDGKVRRVYLGHGGLADYFAAHAEAERLAAAYRRAALAEEQAAVAEARAAAAPLDAAVRTLLDVTLRAAGYRPAARTLRTYAMDGTFHNDPDRTEAERYVFDPGSAGRSRSRRRSTDLPVPDGPAVADIGARAEAKWLDVIGGSDPAGRTAAEEQLTAFKASLGADGSPLETVLVSAIAMAWLETAYFSARSAEAGRERLSHKHLIWLIRSGDAAHRRLGYLVRQLAAVQTLLDRRPSTHG